MLESRQEPTWRSVGWDMEELQSIFVKVKGLEVQ